MRHLSRIVLCAALFVGVTSSWADDTPKPGGAPDPLATARGQIEKKQWPAALAELRRLDDKSNADWQNLMGYTLRKNQPPDLATAEKHYDAALRLDPKHRGALEYSGELYLMTGRLPLAEQQLARLDKLCLLPCEEYTDLKKSIARYKASSAAAAPAR